MKKALLFASLVDAISEWVGRVASFLIVGMMVALIIEVVARYVFTRPTLWAHEVGLFSWGIAGMLLGAYALRSGAHVSVDILSRRWSPRTKAIVDLITSSLFFYFFALLIWKGAEAALNSVRCMEHTSSLWGPPVYPVKAVIPIAAFLILLQGVAKSIRDFVTATRRANTP